MTRPPIVFLSAENPKYSCSWTLTCRKIDAFDYDETSGTLLNRRTIVKVDPSLGVSWFISSKIIVFWRWHQLLVTYFKLTYFIFCASLWRLFCQSLSLNQPKQWHHPMSYLHSERVVLHSSSGLDRLWTLISVYTYPKKKFNNASVHFTHWKGYILTPMVISSVTLTMSVFGLSVSRWNDHRCWWHVMGCYVQWMEGEFEVTYQTQHTVRHSGDIHILL